MIIGVGFDMVEIQRMESWADDEVLRLRYFHREELDDMAIQNKLISQSLAARFAAKEAFGKALGTGIRGFALTDVRVVSDELGKPELRLYDTALKRMRDRGGARAFLSLSHEKTYAGAVVVIEGTDG